MIEAGQCDFVKDIAVPYPLTVLMNLMGIPDDDIADLQELDRADRGGA